MLTDSLSLFEAIMKAPITAEKRLMIDLATVKDAYEKRYIALVGFIRTEKNLTDSLTKVKPPGILESILATARMDHLIDHWVNRK